MSALTKVFVLLQVVLSMLLVAGLVVYVNQAENYVGINKALASKVSAAEGQATRAQSEALAARSDTQLVQQAYAARAQALNNELTNARKEVADHNAQLAKANADLAAVTGAVKSASEAMQLGQTTIATLQTQMGELRNSADKVQGRNTELELALSEANATLQVTERQRRDLAEQLAAAKEENADLRSSGGQTSMRPTATSAGMVGGGPGRQAGQAIVGEVRGRRVINGVPFATINLGSSEGVTRDMTFYVIDRQGNFLGTLVIVSVTPDDATGRLQGERINEIASGNQVRTQL